MSASIKELAIIKKIRRIPAVKQFDALLFAAVLALTIAGYYFLYIVRPTFSDTDKFTDANLNRQLFAIVIGVIAALFLSSVDYRYYQLPSYAGYLVSVFILFLTTLFGFGGSDTKRWTVILGVNFQPSELAKITFVVVIASFLERIAQKKAKKSDYVKLIIYGVLPIALVQLQKDTGTALVFLFVFAIMIFASGLKYRYVFALLGAVIASLPFLWNFVLHDKQKIRVMVFLNPELDRTNTGYQAYLARNAIGAGELIGRRIESGALPKYALVPERHTDFIFTVIAERTGFIGCVLLICLYAFILLRCFYIASTTRDRYGELMVAGFSAMMMFHFIENVGMCVGILPITGIPLPFVSYGGTAMIANFAAIGVILSVSVSRFSEDADPPDYRPRLPPASKIRL